MRRIALSILLLFIIFAGCTTSERTKSPADDTGWRDVDLPAAPADVAQRIKDNRTRTIALELRGPDGNPLAKGTTVHVYMKKHEFLFGCNLFNIHGFNGNAWLQKQYTDHFSALFNYATLPFYWSWYEQNKGKPDELTRTRDMSAWCAKNNITPKGHPLIWHENVPAWADSIARADFEGRLQKRVSDIVSGFSGTVAMFDVINESTVSDKFDNNVGKWVKSLGSVEAVKRGFTWAAAANPNAFLLINDFNVSGAAGDAYYNQINSLIDEGVTPDAIGLQSHMHHGVWSNKDIWNVCEKFAPLNIPLHFTELTILSGDRMAADDWDYATTRTGWKTTAKGEASQAKDVLRVYRLIFSHPSTRAITWWDLSDDNAWMGAPSGLLRKDLSEKLAYKYLMKLVHGEWWTDKTLTADDAGCVSFRGYYGDYELSAEDFSADFALSRESAESTIVSLKKDSRSHRRQGENN